MSKLSRRTFLGAGMGATAAFLRVKGSLAIPQTIGADATEPLVLDASAAPEPVLTGFLRMGTARSPQGHELIADSRSLLLDGNSWLPVMGEFHYSRYPEAEWRDELLKMKAGGVDIAATYVFWIHHEEIEGAFDWPGCRSLRHFVELCQETGLYAFVRCGPWCHGEVRNGGLPDWLLKKGFRLRSNDPGYLEKAASLYGEIAGQLRGLLWKDGGPVVGIQCENEYDGPSEHLITLKRIARDAGLDVPQYTRTGWPEPRTKMPLGEMLPLFGGYAEGFWDRVITPMPGKYGDAFRFRLPRKEASITADQPGVRQAGDGDDVGPYPYCCCEIGGGMMCSYHRRIHIAARDVEALKSRGVEADIFDLGVGEFVGKFEFFGIEDEDILEFPAVGKTEVHALVAHAGLGEFEETFDPGLLQLDSHDYTSGIFTGPVTVLDWVPAVKMTSTPPPG